MLFTIENWGNLQLLIDFRWLKFAKCHMTHPTVQRHGDFQSQMAIAVQLKQKRKKKKLPKQEWGVVQVLLLYFHHVSSESVGSGRRATSTGDSDLFAMQTFFVFFQSAKSMSREQKQQQQMCRQQRQLSSALHTVLLVAVVVVVVVVNVNLMRKVYTRQLRNCDLFCIF